MGDRAALDGLVATLTAEHPALADRIAAARQDLGRLDPNHAGWRLQAAAILLRAGADPLAVGQLREFVRCMGRPDGTLRGLGAEVAQLAILLGDHAPLQRYLRACYGADVQVTIGSAHQHRMRGVVEWSLANGRSTFTFCNRIVAATTHNKTALKHWAASLPMLLQFAQTRPTHAGSVRMSLEDYGYCPGLAFCDHLPDRFLIPDPIYLGTHAYRDARGLLDARDRPWPMRRPVAYWRGNPTGLREEGPATDWRRLPRAALCRIARAGPAQDSLDVFLTGVAQLKDVELADARASGWMGPYEPIETMMDYQFQIDIDGNSNAWKGLFLKLYSGSPVLKVQSPRNFRQWYYDRLQPWINVVPVAEDMSDLHAKLLWLKENSALAATIGANGRALAAAMLPEREIPAAFPVIQAAFAAAAEQRHARSKTRRECG